MTLPADTRPGNRRDVWLPEDRRSAYRFVSAYTLMSMVCKCRRSASILGRLVRLPKAPGDLRPPHVLISTGPLNSRNRSGADATPRAPPRHSCDLHNHLPL